MSSSLHPPIPEIGRLVNVTPVLLKEAALDSPTFRATTVHFAEQLDFVERWLDGYTKTAAKLSAELSALEHLTGSFLGHVTTPITASEAVLDHDYALLALKRYGDSAKDFWSSVTSTLRKSDSFIAEPIRSFIQNDLRHFRETRRIFDSSQKQYDQLQSRYASQGKSKEPSSLREDAFQLHEARKAYLKASMDFSIQAPQLKLALDKLLVNCFYDQWRDFRVIRDNNSVALNKWGQEMERIKGWTHELENSEKSSRRDLLAARKQIEEAAELAARPSRELEDYSVSTVPYLGTRGPTSFKMAENQTFSPQKQGWVGLRTFTGKPTRTVWVRRWAFLKHGIFGCLVQGSRTGGVEESERIGVLLCSIRPAFQEERRFCFEVKTKNNTILLQAENQKELTEWIGSFEAAKRRALENPSPDLPILGKTPAQDPAFAISQPPAPEFAADVSESLTPNANDEPFNLERNPTLPVPDRDGQGARGSADFPRRSTGIDRDTEGGREHGSRLIQKLDLHRKSTTGMQQAANSGTGGSGIASLISASHSLLPAGPPLSLTGAEPESSRRTGASAPAYRDISGNSLAPPTLANPPAPTNMSRAAVMVSNDRGVGIRATDGIGGVPSGMMANLWGSTNWGQVTKLQRERSPSRTNHVEEKALGHTESNTSSPTNSPTRSPISRHRQTISLGGGEGTGPTKPRTVAHEYPPYYPQQLKPQDAQFRLLFPNIPWDESLVFVFRATFSSNDQQDFPGRAYATTRNLYFYSNHFGLVLTSSVGLSSISEVTAGAGRDCDFLFLHILPEMGTSIPGRLTVKTFLEPVRLLQKRLNLLIHAAIAEEPTDLESMFKSLMKVETDGPTRTPSIDSWEDVPISTPADDGATAGGPHSEKQEKLINPGIYIDKDLRTDRTKQGQQTDLPRFRLPSQPVQYVPQGDLNLAAEKYYDVGPKALFHVLFGDRSPTFQLLLLQRRAQDIKKGPWKNIHSSHMRRDFGYRIDVNDYLGRQRLTDVSDYQIVDVLNEHLCYAVTDKRTPWHLPFKRCFRLVSKIVITHVSRSRCKLAIYTKVEWLWKPYIIRGVIDKQAMNDLEQDALDLIDLVSDQVKKLGPYSQTKKSISLYGQLGHQVHGIQFTGESEVLESQLCRPRKQSGILPLLLETSGSLLQSAVSSLMIWFWALLRWIWKTSRANWIILILLFSSLVINMFHSYNDTLDWIQERNARNFMARMGVHPNAVTGKAIYIKDMDEAIAPVDNFGSHNSSTCFSVFRENNSGKFLDDTGPFIASSSMDPKNRAAQRFQRTRQRLGNYRYDLLVALRMVNSIEKEVLRAEWEKWLRQETQRCRVVDVLLNDRQRGRENQNDEGNDDISGVKQRLLGKEGDIERWHKDYCFSCEREQARVRSPGD